MKPFQKYCVVLFTICLLGCAGSPARIALMTSEDLKEVDAYNLCAAYAYGGHDSEKIEKELKRRDIFSPEEWDLIKNGKIRIGMSNLGLVCSWGKPGLDGSINKTTTRYGTRVQWVYRSCRYCKGNYVYTENGEITGIQNFK